MEIKVGTMVEIEERLPRKADVPEDAQRHYRTWVTGRVMTLTPKGAHVHWKHLVKGKTRLSWYKGYSWVPFSRMRLSPRQVPMSCADCHRSETEIEGTFVEGNPFFPNSLWVVTPEEGEILCEECWRRRFLVPQVEE